MLQPEKLFFTKLLLDKDTQGYTALKARGLSAGFFAEVYRPILSFIEDYLAKYTELPSKEEVLEKFTAFKPATLFTEEIPKAALGAIYDNLVKEQLRDAIRDDFQQLIEEFKAEGSDPYNILTGIVKSSSELTSKFLTRSSEATTLAESAQSLLDELDGKIVMPPGIAPSLLFIEDQSKGWQPGDLTSIVARTGVGKTWMLSLNVVTATTGNPYHFYDTLTLPSGIVIPSKEERIARRKRVLFLSLEMPARAIMKRLAVLYARISYSRYKDGTMTETERKKLRHVLELMSQDTNKNGVGSHIKVIGPGAAMTPDAVHAAAVEFNADLVVIDGFYLMPGPGDDRWKKVEANMQQLRLYSLLSGKHYMLASQLKAQTGKTLASTDIDSLAFSSSIGHDSTNVIALVQTKNDIHANIMYATILKMREGVPGQEYVYSWDHTEGIYTQQGLVVDDSFSGFN